MKRMTRRQNGQTDDGQEPELTHLYWTERSDVYSTAIQCRVMSYDIFHDPIDKRCYEIALEA